MTEDSNESKQPVPPSAPDPVLEAIRIELRALVETPQLCSNTLNRLAQVSEIGRAHV